MKNKILVLIAGLLFYGANVYAAGDLIVNGKLGAGTSSPSNRLHVIDTNTPPLNAVGTRTTNTSYDGTVLITTNDSAVSPTYGSAGMKVNLEHTGSGTGPNSSWVGANYTITLSGSSSSNAEQAVSQFNLIRMNNPNGIGYNLNKLNGTLIKFQDTSGGSSTNTVGDMVGLYLDIIGNSGGSNYTVANQYQLFVRDFGGDMGAAAKARWTVANSSGIWLEKQTLGDTKNYGIVLAGDGAGADIVFGASQQASIYSSAGLLYAKDMNGNITQFSPHDPETGEWIYYSQNTKTGVVKRVNMEKLVKAVEKLTGETFMIETIEK